jgi:hypothetical protein
LRYKLAVVRCGVDLTLSYKNSTFICAKHRGPQAYRLIVERNGRCRRRPDCHQTRRGARLTEAVRTLHRSEQDRRHPDFCCAPLGPRFPSSSTEMD